MALERFWWGPSLDLLRDSRNGTPWLEHCMLVFTTKTTQPRAQVFSVNGVLTCRRLHF